MGVLLVIEPPIAESGYDKIRIYKSSSQTGQYTLLKEQSATDTSYYDIDGDENSWYKVAYYDSTKGVESGLSNAIKGITETYTTARKVADFLQIPDFTDSTRVTIAQVVRLVNWAEEYVDNYTGQAWREKVATEEYYNIENYYSRHLGHKIYLRNRNVRKFDSAKGDKLEVWNGNSWENWSNKVESRNGDFWFDYAKGILFLRSFGAMKYGVRITYRYGATEVPLDVEEATTLIVAAKLISSEDRSILLPEGTSHVPYSEKIEMWKKQANEILERYKELKPIY